MAGPIPAHAGQPQCPARSTPRTWAYPRSRGATRPVYLVYLNDEGLSPLTRGNHLRQRAGVFNPGPIPAHAGQPTRRFVAPMARWAYPRSRGATGSRGTVTLLSMGLSPLTRGNLLLPRFPCRAPGPIPAHAGQPPCWCQSCGTGGAYPRSRGATFSSTHTVRPFGGLSPLTRGNQKKSHPKVALKGPIPAHAGQPAAAPGSCLARWAYPRSRGATPVDSHPSALATGLSPLTRGNRLDLQLLPRLPGPIPAHAGQPRLLRAGLIDEGAYPRSRGATTATPSPGRPVLGLSPLTRGNRLGP